MRGAPYPRASGPTCQQHGPDPAGAGCGPSNPNQRLKPPLAFPDPLQPLYIPEEGIGAMLKRRRKQ